MARRQELVHIELQLPFYVRAVCPHPAVDAEASEETHRCTLPRSARTRKDVKFTVHNASRWLANSSLRKR